MPSKQGRDELRIYRRQPPLRLWRNWHDGRVRRYGERDRRRKIGDVHVAVKPVDAFVDGHSSIVETTHVSRRGHDCLVLLNVQDILTDALKNARASKPFGDMVAPLF